MIRLVCLPNNGRWFLNLNQRGLNRIVALVFVGLLSLFALLEIASGQDVVADDSLVQLNFPDQIELKLLIEYVSQRLNIKILFDEAVSNKQITIKAPNQIPAQSLLNLLESALKIKGLALVDADIPGWKQVVTSGDLTRIAKPKEDLAETDLAGTIAVTQAFELSFVAPEKISQIIKPFLTEPGANVITIPEQKLIIITDYARNLERISKLVETIDQAGPASAVEYYEVRHVEAALLAQQVTQMLAGRKTPDGREVTFSISPDDRTNQLVLVGSAAYLEEVIKLIKVLDVPLGLKTEVYSFQFVAAERIENLVDGLIDPLTKKRLYRSVVDSADNLLVVTAPQDIHDRIRILSKQMDVESKRPGSSVKFYKLKYADAEQLIQTLQSIQQNGSSPFGPLQGTIAGPSRGISPLGRGSVGAAATSLGQQFQNQAVPGPNYPATPGQVLPTQTPALQQAGQGGPLFQPQPLQSTFAVPSEYSSNSLLPDTARVTADAHTNSIIVVGDRSSQEIYKNLIEFLDKHRPQVMIESQIVIIDTSDDYSLGVELSLGDRTGAQRLFSFTSFGLSMVDPTNGALSILPGRGLNAALIDPEDGDAVLRALANHNRARVLSVPRVLVDDNSTGSLASVTEVPFTSVNASNTVATTSFAGFAEAGTTIEVTPRISEDDHLALDYVITLNSFTGPGSAGVPPPRQTDEIRSTVTIPDGHTVIVGGLNRKNTSLNFSGVPGLEKIPILRRLSSTETDSKSQTTLYVFLRPVILRDDKFRDLKFMSDQNLNCAGCRENFPQSKPMLVR